MLNARVDSTFCIQSITVTIFRHTPSAGSVTNNSGTLHMRSSRSPCPLSPVSELKFVKFHHSMTMDKFCRANSDYWRGQCMRLQRCPPRPGRSKNLETPYFALHPPHPPLNVNSPTRPPIRPAHKLTQPLWLRTLYEGLTHYMRSLVMTK